MARRHYSDADRAAALAALDANGGNIAGTARQLGVPESTLRSWSDKPDNAAPADLREHKRLELAELLEQWLRVSLEHVLAFHEIYGSSPTEGTMKAAQIGAGIATDKLLALRDELPTERQESDTVIRIVREDKLPEATDD